MRLVNNSKTFLGLISILFLSNCSLIFSILIQGFLFTQLFLFTSCKDEITQPTPKPPAYQEDILWPSLANSPWPMGNHDPQNTGRSKYAGPSNGQVVDSIPAFNLQSGCVVGEDSTVYFITSNLAVLTAVDFSGNIKWKRTIAVESVTAPLIDNKNRIYAVGGKSLFCFSSIGDTLWEFICEGRFFVSANLTIDKNGNIYLVDDTHTLYSILPDGSLNWKFTDIRIPALSIHSPAFSPDGSTIYIQGDQVSLIAIDINNVSIKWTFGNTTAYSGAVVDCQGNIYLFPGERVVSNSGPYTFYCLNPSGMVNWSYTITDEFLGFFDTPTIDRLGNIYFGNDSLYSFSYKGIMNWKKYIGKAAIKTSIICDRNNDIYLGTVDKTLYAFRQDSVLKFILPLNNNIRSLIQPVIAFDGIILLPTFRDNKIFYIK